MQIELTGNFSDFLFCFFGKSAVEIFRNNFSSVSEHIINQQKKKAAHAIQHKKGQERNQVEQGVQQYFKQPRSQDLEVRFKKVFAVKAHNVRNRLIGGINDFK